MKDMHPVGLLLFCFFAFSLSFSLFLSFFFSPFGFFRLSFGVDSALWAAFFSLRRFFLFILTLFFVPLTSIEIVRNGERNGALHSFWA